MQGWAFRLRVATTAVAVVFLALLVGFLMRGAPDGQRALAMAGVYLLGLLSILALAALRFGSHWGALYWIVRPVGCVLLCRSKGHTWGTEWPDLYEFPGSDRIQICTTCGKERKLPKTKRLDP